jgi:methionyl-tRNA formyltransferase
MNLIAIGRSRYLYDSIKHLTKVGFTFKAIVTDLAYEEYDVKHEDFEILAAEIGASFYLTKAVNTTDLPQIIKAQDVKAGISVNWRYTVPEDFLALFEFGILNFHLGNLPDYKGNATVNWSILNGETEIYANIHKMDAALDAGDVISRKAISIETDTYIADILKQAEEIAPGLYEDALIRLSEDQSFHLIKGNTSGSRCYPRLPEDSQISWSNDAAFIHKLIRASSHPYKGAYSFLDGEQIRIMRGKSIQVSQKFYAIPGHVVEVDKATKKVYVACSNNTMLEIEEIEVNGKRIAPTDLIKSIRVRFRHYEQIEH